jgi:hypothetical protein
MTAGNEYGLGPVSFSFCDNEKKPPILRSGIFSGKL